MIPGSGYILIIFFVAGLYFIYRNHSANFLFFEPFSTTSVVIGSITKIGGILNKDQAWNKKFNLFSEQNLSILTYETIFGPTVLVGDSVASRAVFNNKGSFGKRSSDYALVSFFGPNLVTTVDDQWRRHRKLTAPAFSESANELAWDHSVRLTQNWLELLESKGKPGEIFHEADTTSTALRLALMIISITGFGIVDVEQVSAENGELGFIESLRGVTEGMIIKLTFPEWAYKLPFELPRHTKRCFTELESTLRELIISRKIEIKAGLQHSDLFSMLLEGDKYGSESTLSADEILSNCYVFLLAGHETTAHSLAFVLTLLAIYPENQTILFEEAISVAGGNPLSYGAYSSLPYTVATVRESLRLYSPVLALPRVCLEDATLPAVTMTPEGKAIAVEIPVKKGSRVFVTTSGIHFNPLDYPQPHEFRPSRFLETKNKKWNREAFVAFAGGNRNCIGSRFALVQLVAILSTICQNYEIFVPSNLVAQYSLRDDETERSRRDRIFKVVHLITLNSPKLPLSFKRRTKVASV